MKWYQTHEKLELNTPSRADGVDFETEARYRKEGAQFIMEIGNKLRLPYLTMASGIVFFHRFYMFHSFKEFSRWVTAPTCLFLAGKVEETPKKCRDLLKVTQFNLSDKRFKAFGEHPREELMIIERILLQTIKFDLQLTHPYSYLIKFGKLLKGERDKINEFVQKAWIFINDSLSTTLCLIYPPEVVALAVLLLSFKLSNQNIRDFLPKPRSDWWKTFYPEAKEAELEGKHIFKDLLEEKKNATFSLIHTCKAEAVASETRLESRLDICEELTNMYKGKPPKRRFPNATPDRTKGADSAKESPRIPGSPQAKKPKPPTPAVSGLVTSSSATVTTTSTSLSTTGSAMATTSSTTTSMVSFSATTITNSTSAVSISNKHIPLTVTNGSIAVPPIGTTSTTTVQVTQGGKPISISVTSPSTIPTTGMANNPVTSNITPSQQTPQQVLQQKTTQQLQHYQPQNQQQQQTFQPQPRPQNHQQQLQPQHQQQQQQQKPSLSVSVNQARHDQLKSLLHLQTPQQQQQQQNSPLRLIGQNSPAMMSGSNTPNTAPQSQLIQRTSHQPIQQSPYKQQTAPILDHMSSFFQSTPPPQPTVRPPPQHQKQQQPQHQQQQHTMQGSMQNQQRLSSQTPQGNQHQLPQSNMLQQPMQQTPQQQLLQQQQQQHLQQPHQQQQQHLQQHIPPQQQQQQPQFNTFPQNFPTIPMQQFQQQPQQQQQHQVPAPFPQQPQNMPPSMLPPGQGFQRPQTNFMGVPPSNQQSFMNPPGNPMTQQNPFNNNFNQQQPMLLQNRFPQQPPQPPQQQPNMGGPRPSQYGGYY